MPECDIEKTGVTLELLEAPPDSRDAAWRRKFYGAVATASFRCADPQVVQGPDGFPYFGLLSPEPAVPFESFCISNLLETLTENGFGVVLNPRPAGPPDWVFSFGDLLTLRLFQSFEVADAGTPALSENVIMKRGESVMVGQPSDAYLPGYARRAIDGFLRTRGIQNPKVFLMHRPGDDPPQQLVFSAFPEDFQSEGEFKDVVRRISWFLPRHYPVIAIEKKSDLSKSFEPLWDRERESPSGESGAARKPWYRFWS